MGGPRIHYNGGGIVNMNASLPRIPVQYFKGGGKVEGVRDKAASAFNMLPQVKAAKWLGGKAMQAFQKGKEIVGDKLKSAKIVKSSPSQIVINPPPTISPEVITDDPVGDAKTRNVKKLAPDQELPEFSAGKMRSGSKIKTLGIAV